MSVASIANDELRRIGSPRIVVVTSRSTGEGVLAGLDLGAADVAVSLRYSDRNDRWVASDDSRSIERVEELVTHRGLLGTFDLVVVDPFHTFASSERVLRLALRLARPGALLLSHDCAPPPDTTEPEQPERVVWAGVTFAAFREVCERLRLPWCTIDADFGIGVAIAPSRSDDALLREPLHDDADTIAWHHEHYRADRIAHMRVVAPDHAVAAITALRAGTSVDHLLVATEGDRNAPGPLHPAEESPGPPTTADEDPIAALARARAELDAILASRIWRSTAWYRSLRNRRRDRPA